MKKLGKFLLVGALVATVAAGAVGFAACGNSSKTYTGEYKYANPYDATKDGYGVSVTVKVKGDEIVSVTCTDPAGYHNITASWDEGNGNKAANGLNDYLKKFEGAKVSDIKAINVSKKTDGTPNTDEAAKTAQGAYIYTGATQTSGRIILAIQDALKDVK